MEKNNNRKNPFLDTIDSDSSKNDGNNGVNIYPKGNTNGNNSIEYNDVNFISDNLQMNVEKIDKLYFHKDKQGNRFMKGTLLVVYDNKTGAYGNVMACLEEDLDKTLSKVSQIRIQLQKEMKHYHDIKSKLTYGS